ncbi:MAG: nucleotide exchange factor GrpE [Solirubrobacteraceae bacterium]
MTEIKITVDGESESELSPDASQASGADGAGGDGTSASSSGALAPDEGAAAPSTGPGGHTADRQGASEDEAVEIEGELDELIRTAKQRDDYLALAQRTQADFENYRKRVARDAAAARDRGVGSLAKELLPALDNLDRALEAAAEDDPLLQGVRLVRAELKAALARAGIESFCPLGEPFDPSVHEAVATAEQPPGGRPSGTVVEVYQDGYRLGEGILRPARVVVAA